MATWVGKITLACPTGRVVRKLVGSPDDVIKRATKFSLPGCNVQKVELVKRGIGAGAPDRREGERLEGGRRRAMWVDPGADSHLMMNTHRHVAGFGSPSWWPFGHKKPAARHPMTKTVYYQRTKDGSYIQVDRPPTRTVSRGPAKTIKIDRPSSIHTAKTMHGARRKKRRR